MKKCTFAAIIGVLAVALAYAAARPKGAELLEFKIQPDEVGLSIEVTNSAGETAHWTGQQEWTATATSIHVHAPKLQGFSTSEIDEGPVVYTVIESGNQTVVLGRPSIEPAPTIEIIYGPATDELVVTPADNSWIRPEFCGK